MTTITSNQPELTSTTFSPTRMVHFDLSSSTCERTRAERPRHQRRSRPTLPDHPKQPSAESVYGFYLTPETALLIGGAIFPELKAQDPNDHVLQGTGLLYANAFCLEEFPTIPLKWRSGVLGLVEGASRPLIVLGHRNTKNEEEIYVNQEQLQMVQTTLHLGDQKPEWYTVTYVT